MKKPLPIVAVDSVNKTNYGETGASAAGQKILEQFEQYFVSERSAQLPDKLLLY